MFERVKHRQIPFGKLWFTHEDWLNGWMIAKDASVYLKPNNIISHRLPLNGMHEPHLETLIAEVLVKHRDFFSLSDRTLA